jgi:hypothetical protein
MLKSVPVFSWEAIFETVHFFIHRFYGAVLDVRPNRHDPGVDRRDSGIR